MIEPPGKPGTSIFLPKPPKRPPMIGRLTAAAVGDLGGAREVESPAPETYPEEFRVKLALTKRIWVELPPQTSSTMKLWQATGPEPPE